MDMPNKDEVRAAVHYLWSIAPDDEMTSDALLVVLPVVDAWLERLEVPLRERVDS